MVAQRLARRLCEECKQPLTVTAEELRRSGFENVAGPIDAYEPVGCVRNGTGFQGRVGVNELMEVTEQISSLILRRASSGEIAAAAVADGMLRMRDDGLDKVRQGITSVPEVLRVVGR